MTHLPSLLADIPLRVSFVPMRGCVHFCSFCADNSGKRVLAYPFEVIKKTIFTYPFPLKSVALYNACDALSYRWHSGKKVHTLLDIIDLFKKKNCHEFLLSSPGIWPDGLNKTVVDAIARDSSVSLMLSFNREHLLHQSRLNDFYWTAKAILKWRRLYVRMVYCSPGEKHVLYKELKRMFGNDILSNPIDRAGESIETVPVAPMGRGKALYFRNAGNDKRWHSRLKTMILEMFREEESLRDILYIAECNYDDFLQHAAVQFSGMFIFLLVPGDDGGELILKATDVEKVVRTGGASIATLYRYNPVSKKFERATHNSRSAHLDCLLVDSRTCSLPDFVRFIENRISPEDTQSAGRIFSALIASNIMNEKCAVNDSMRMIFLNEEYRTYVQKAFEALIVSRGFPPRAVRRLFPVVMEYLQSKGEVI